MSFVICYCCEAFPLTRTADLPDISAHIQECPARRQLSPVTSLIQKLDESATDQQRRVLLAELRLELSNMQSPVPNAPLGHAERPFSLQLAGRHLSVNDGRDSKSAGLISTCRVCAKQSDLIQTTCQHWLCTMHIRNDFENNYKRGSGNIRCPAPGCGHPLAEADLVVAVGLEALANARRLLH